MIWKQLGLIKGKKLLDFGSGSGVTADHFARDNEVYAVEPSEEMLKTRVQTNDYTQLIGSTEQLAQLEAESFDVILCHNVLEYIEDRKPILNEFHRILKPQGILSVVKHNRLGRVMQMTVLLNDFDTANSLLDGKDGISKQFGTISYYADDDLTGWHSGFTVENIHGIRTFWDLQQNQEIQKDPDWQEKMLQIEERASDIDEFRRIAFLHHVILAKLN